MHPVPPDWALKGTSTPQDIEDEKPDEKTPAINKEGGTKKDHENEFFDDDKDNDKNNNEDEKKKRKKIEVESVVEIGSGFEILKKIDIDISDKNIVVNETTMKTEIIKSTDVEIEVIGMEVVEEVVKEVEPVVAEIDNR